MGRKSPVRRWIIPARAGFTMCPRRPLGGPADHPRSRGVYGRQGRLFVLTNGSSPLARGLPWWRRRTRRRPGIIPARAGFTRQDCGRRVRHEDHPRSRGVYGREQPGRRRRHGSSPLARGLLAQDSGRDETDGIIPARAGFTVSILPTHPHAWDHPRSRGVYPSRPSRALATRGSSPLARGLHPPGARQPAHTGIIPARAGFTRRRGGQGRTHPDHPRSRGVYSRACSFSQVVRGSSPLARGLRSSGLRKSRSNRIIPARAGFTARLPPAHLRVQDHPRSRGVYIYIRISPSRSSGSSPLARGLPSPRTMTTPASRIIPARAGFTCRIVTNDDRVVDHPRSRGVYGIIPTNFHGLDGSSPLARGLHLRIVGIPTNP